MRSSFFFESLTKMLFRKLRWSVLLLLLTSLTNTVGIDSGEEEGVFRELNEEADYAEGQGGLLSTVAAQHGSSSPKQKLRSRKEKLYQIILNFNGGEIAKKYSIPKRSVPRNNRTSGFFPNKQEIETSFARRRRLPPGWGWGSSVKDRQSLSKLKSGNRPTGRKSKVVNPEEFEHHGDLGCRCS